MARRRGTVARAKGKLEEPVGGLEKKVVELYRQGLPVKEISEITGIKSMAKLYRIIRRYAETRKRKRKKWKPSDKEIRELCDLKRRGVSIYQLSRRFDRSPSTIWHYLKRYCKQSS